MTPARWPVAYLEEVAQIEMGQSPAGEFTNSASAGWPLVGGAADIRNGRISATRYTTAATKICSPGDTLICIRATIGKPVIADRAYCIGRGVAALRANDLHPRWLFHFIRSIESELSRSGTGSTFLQINHADIARIRIPVPSINTQRTVVDAIEAVEVRIRRARGALSISQADCARLRQSILAAAFRGDLTADWREKNRDVEPASVLLDRIRKERREKWEEAELAKMQAKCKTPADDRWKQKYVEPTSPVTEAHGDIPEGWSWATLDQLSTKISDGVHKKPDYVADGIPFLTVRNLTAGKGMSFDRTSFISRDDHEEFCKRTKPERGDILISKDGTLGVTRVIETDREFSIFVSLALVKPVFRSMSSYLAAMISSPQGQSRLKATGTGLMHIHLVDLRAAVMPLCSQPEMQEMLCRLDAHDAAISVVEQSVHQALDTIDDLESAILAKAFRGELVPQDPNDEPASVLLERIRSQRAATEGEPKRQRRTKTRGRETTTEPEPAAIAEATAPHLPIRRRVAAPEPQSARPTIAEVPLEDLLAAIRRVLATGPRDRDTLIRDVARELGFARTGDRVYAAIDSAITTASRRLIVRSERGVFTLYSPSIDAYGKEELKTLFLSAIGTTWHDREDAIRTTARYLGFKRTGEVIDVRLRSVINGLIREQRLERDGSAIRRV